MRKETMKMQFETSIRKGSKVAEAVGVMVGATLLLLIWWYIGGKKIPVLQNSSYAFAAIGVMNLLLFIAYSASIIQVTGETTILKGFLKGLHLWGKIINNSVSTILLVIVYIIAIGPVALGAKIRKKRFLNIDHPGEESHYMAKSIGNNSRESYYRQF